MKIKVLKRFHDRITNQLYNVGEIVEVTDERGAEIISSRFEVAEEIKEVGDANNGAPTGDADDLENLNVDQLKAKAEEMGIDTKGLRKKGDLLKAIKNK